VLKCVTTAAGNKVQKETRRRKSKKNKLERKRKEEAMSDDAPR
jgi:hypothetical protein